MSKDATFRLLVLACVALLAYIVWTNTREIVELELELDRLRGGLDVGGVNPVPPAEKTIGPNTKFEETLNG